MRSIIPLTHLAGFLGVALALVCGVGYVPDALAQNPATPPAGASPAEDLAFWEELAFWDAIKDSENPADFEAYLQKYPKGRFLPLAQMRIEALKQKTGSTAPSTDVGVTPAASDYIVVRATKARAQPRANAPALANLRKGEALKGGIKDADSDWVRFQLTDGQAAYVPAASLQAQPAATVATADPAATKAPEQTDAQGLPGGLKAGDKLRDCPDCPQLVVIASGRFDMGSSQGRKDEQPVHSVTIAHGFALGVFEVTLGEWDVCLREGDCRYSPERKPGDERIPVHNVSWDDAQQYTRWLSNKTHADYRLPTEAEWEYAARAGSKTNYWWGDKPGHNEANCKDCGSQWDDREPAPVGSFRANPFGLYDVHGNVWEWTADCWNDNYGGAPSDGSAWSQGDCIARVLRGGSWKLDTEYMRVSRRSRYDRDVRYYLHGFRIAKTLR